MHEKYECLKVILNLQRHEHVDFIM